MRSLQQNMTCPQCKSQLDQVICSSSLSSSWDDFTIWGDDIGPQYLYDFKSQIFFPKEYFKHEIESLWILQCVICKKSKKDIKAMKHHLGTEHNLIVCMLCIENRHLFPSEFRAYNQTDVCIYIIDYSYIIDIFLV